MFICGIVFCFCVYMLLAFQIGTVPMAILGTVAAIMLGFVCVGMHKKLTSRKESREEMRELSEILSKMTDVVDGANRLGDIEDNVDSLKSFPNYDIFGILCEIRDLLSIHINEEDVLDFDECAECSLDCCVDCDACDNSCEEDMVDVLLSEMEEIRRMLQELSEKLDRMEHNIVINNSSM